MQKVLALLEKAWRKLWDYWKKLERFIRFSGESVAIVGESKEEGIGITKENVEKSWDSWRERGESIGIDIESVEKSVGIARRGVEKAMGLMEKT